MGISSSVAPGPDPEVEDARGDHGPFASVLRVHDARDAHPDFVPAPAHIPSQRTPDTSSSSSRRGVYWIPMSVLALGLASIALLLWNRQVDERRADDAALANAVMDLRIHAATAQLWADRFMLGGSAGQRALGESALLDVAHLADVLTAGGEGKDFLVVRPPD